LTTARNLRLLLPPPLTLLRACRAHTFHLPWILHPHYTHAAYAHLTGHTPTPTTCAFSPILLTCAHAYAVPNLPAYRRCALPAFTRTDCLPLPYTRLHYYYTYLPTTHLHTEHATSLPPADTCRAPSGFGSCIWTVPQVTDPSHGSLRRTFTFTRDDTDTATTLHWIVGGCYLYVLLPAGTEMGCCHWCTTDPLCACDAAPFTTAHLSPAASYAHRRLYLSFLGCDGHLLAFDALPTGLGRGTSGGAGRGYGFHHHHLPPPPACVRLLRTTHRQHIYRMRDHFVALPSRPSTVPPS